MTDRDRGVPMAGSATLSQINARIDAGQKTAGDAALASAGISPSEAIRALWGLAVRYAGEPGKLSAVLFPDEEARTRRELEEERRRKVALVSRCGSLVDDELASRGISLAHIADEQPYNQLKEDAYAEKYGPDLGWQ